MCSVVVAVPVAAVPLTVMVAAVETRVRRKSSIIGWATYRCQDTPEVDAPTEAPPAPNDSDVQDNYVTQNRVLLKNWTVKFDCFKSMFRMCVRT